MAECCRNEPDGVAVRAMARKADGLFSSAICMAEMACVAHRKVREGQVRRDDAIARQDLLMEDIFSGVVTTIPVTEHLLRNVERATRALSPDCFLRACDALHLVTAADAGLTEIWTSDRPMLAAAPYFGLCGNTV